MPMQKAVERIWEQIADTGKVTSEQLALINMYEKSKEKPKPKVNTLDQVLKYGNQAVIIIDKIFPTK